MSQTLEQRVRSFERPLKTAELASLLGKQASTLRNWRKTHTPSSQRKVGPKFEQLSPGAGVVYPVEFVLQWIEEQRRIIAAQTNS